MGKTEQDAEQLGWIKISCPLTMNIVSFRPATQAQINTLFDWSRSSNAINKTRRERAYAEWLERQD